MFYEDSKAKCIDLLQAESGLASCLASSSLFLKISKLFFVAVKNLFCLHLFINNFNFYNNQVLICEVWAEITRLLR